MAKALSKSKKLDKIASEIAKVRKELTKLADRQAALAGEIAKLTRTASPRKAKKAAPRPSAASEPAKSKEKQAHPVLVKSPEAAEPTGRKASH